MNDKYITQPCPSCGHQRTPQDSHVHPGVCPSCGIAYAKWQGATEPSSPEPPAHTHTTANESFRRRLLNSFLYIPENTDSVTLWGRGVLWLVFCVWGLSFIFHGLDWEYIGGSFLHNINLPFHEFGHVLFSPFGRFMMILGGSLFQIMMPLIAMLSFSWQMRDNFAASIMLWWCGQSFIDISPYIADAQDRSLPLILGLSEDYHDWGNLLSMTGTLDAAKTIAQTSFFIGSTIMLFALFWGAVILRKQKQTVNEF